MHKYILQTERCYLRELAPLDAANCFLLNQHPEILEFTNDPPFDSEETARKFLNSYDAYIKTGIGRWAVELKTDNSFIGWCGLKYHHTTNDIDIGYRLLPKYWGKGLATETAKGCCDFGMKVLGLKRIYACIHENNLKSLRVAEKLSMQYEKTVIDENKRWKHFVFPIK